MSNIAAAHTHDYKTRVKRKVLLHRYEDIQGNRHSDLSGIDWIHMFKCECGDVQAYDLVREKH